MFFVNKYFHNKIYEFSRSRCALYYLHRYFIPHTIKIRMEQHPIPQNVTSFQFRLIGDMTIKQVLYLGFGLMAAYVCIKLPLPFIFTWPVAFISAVSGIALAFMPVEGQPLDVWVVSFLKSVYGPTQYVWKKSHPAEAQSSLSTTSAGSPARLSAVSQTQASPRVMRQDKKPRTPFAFSLKNILFPMQKPKEARPLVSSSTLYKQQTPPKDLTETVQDIFVQTIKPVKEEGPKIILQASPNNNEDDKKKKQYENGENSSRMKKEMKDAKDKVESLEKEVEKLKEEHAQRHTAEERVLELQKQLTEMLSVKESMEKNLQHLRIQRSQAQEKAKTLEEMPTAQPEGQQTVRVVTSATAKKAGIPQLTYMPNVITGIIKDAENNLLPEVLITVRNEEGIPLRALKTNKLGRFAPSTPLNNGIYVIEAEDPRKRYTFDLVRVKLEGEVVPPIEIIAKSQKQLNREKLEHEVFGGTVS